MFKFNLDHGIVKDAGLDLEQKETLPALGRGADIQKFIDSHNVVDENNEKIKIINFTEATPEELATADDLEAKLNDIPDEHARSFLEDLVRYYRSPTFRDSIPPGGDDNIRDRMIEDPVVDLSVDKNNEGLSDEEKEKYAKLAEALLGNRLRRGNAKLASGYFEEYFNNKEYVDMQFSPETLELAAILKKYFVYEDIDSQKMLKFCQYDIASDEDLYKIVQYNLQFIKLLFEDVLMNAKGAKSV